MAWTDDRLGRHIADQRTDIAVDLMAATSRSRIRLTALRPAPIMVNYLGTIHGAHGTPGPATHPFV